MTSRYCLGIAVLTYVVPLSLITVSALSSGWFNIFNNALSDLGHAVRSSVAPIFNLGLMLGALLMVIFASLFSMRFNKVLSILLIFTGTSLNLVAVFDEVYGVIHFIVSVIFFLSLLILVAAYSYVFKEYVFPSIAITVGVVSWALHFIYRVPRGAAIPELISIFITLPFYMKYAVRVCRDFRTS